MTKHAPLKSIFGLALVFGVTSCDDDETKVQNSVSTTQFVENRISLSENAATSEASIFLNKPATQDGIITISANAENMNGFTTQPQLVDGQIELHVAKGKREVSFSFSPIDNSLLNEDQVINFKIESVSEGLTIGDVKSMAVTIIDDESPSEVGFHQALSATVENAASPASVIIALSHAALGNGSLEVWLAAGNATYGTHYITEPAAVDGKITLPIQPGDIRVQFNVIPLNDQLLNGDRNVHYTINRVVGPFMIGNAIAGTMKITDDELAGRGKGYITNGGGWGYRREYQYNEQGNVSKILWEQYTPGLLAGSYTYEYDASNKVVKMTENEFTETRYVWENGQITKAESFKDGILKKYTSYGYDAAGNVGEAALYNRQPDGELKMSFLFVYLYHVDGNIYKQLTYQPIPDSDEYALISTRTFETYSTVENPFTMVEILPNKKTQPNLPLSYRVEENGHNILYQLSYEFNQAGQPTKRTATSNAGSETSNYFYY